MARPKLTAIKIAAVLTQWRLKADTVEGIVKESLSPDYAAGERIVLLNIRHITHYEEMTEPEQWLVRTQTGLYFRLYKGEEWTGQK